jgi:hypothetical protein
VLVDDEALYAFYAERVPAGIHSTVAFERWRELAEATAPRLLYMTREALMRHAAAGSPRSNIRRRWRWRARRCRSRIGSRPGIRSTA